MKVAILAGGRGTRLAEETALRPKPMVLIGEDPILWHIMKLYSFYGFSEFVIALGYLGDFIKDYFINYRMRTNDISVEVDSGKVTIHGKPDERWKVHLLNTGVETNTGGRVRQLAKFIGNETFLMTYGDGIGDINITKLIECHQRNKRLVTVTAVHPPARFGSISCDGERVATFAEKPQVTEGWINGGFFVIEPEVSSYIEDDGILWEGSPMENLVQRSEVSVYQHNGFWQSMDTVRDVQLLNHLWNEGEAPWKIW
ncbi:MAG: glucose-1-phosphate cytidylyltransferase [SAR324 cluster bacterium]|uniref:Glucose-1-phosphate cytidylyltransferase n=1 Tax=SAR324 cluster bacterium TaxID=2024889 RepID=A0A7X9IL27_9DELT|nr:glucose-1-phosphate cytidylyltransferase [SAR324 cluster bacterium]